ncbi:endoribonuclease Dicer homolog 4 isoform X2 [Amborella trichopoda]|uniref:endoribonuclease Dicer homolog 4 isoform X2 n=1 Tax=Amborella trichopoda TaxID=13333 RepID=UPI0009C024ED|nr:endoribonuclease Dicer homolog 4 isoform X2 [Amborella trichopoda]|eukprot:XP_020525714.1 endoribonuclease Dicer homolog 4 isoform X2 [Amborella trichopoda]
MQASQSTPKDPRIIAREYQKKLCKIALEENTIVYLETGCGKTHIAVLLMYELRHLIRKPSKSICVFLAPTNALVQQQAAVIEHSTDFKVGRYYGNYGNFTSHHDWEEEIQKYEIFVMTPERLLRNLHHCLMRMEFIALLIFDECHNAHKGHPYAQIMKEFYKANTGKNPRIFGMTASPIVGKGGSSQTNYSKSINTLEHLLDAKVHSVEDKEELESLIASPNIKLYYYNPNVDNTCSSFLTCGQKLWQLKDKYLLLLRGNSEEPKELQKKAKLLAKLHKNLMFCLDDIGLWGAAQAAHILLSGDHSELAAALDMDTSTDENCVANLYLREASLVLNDALWKDDTKSGAFVPEALEEPFLSRKLLVLIGILSSYRLREDVKCIIFVKQIITARSLAHLLGNIKCLGFWKCEYLVGFRSGLKTMSRKKMNSIVENFRVGKINLLIATNVAEEGLDIQTCCLVVRYDMPETVASFIQSRGRARMQQSEYAFLVESGNDAQMNLINHFIAGEEHMNQEIIKRSSEDAFADTEDTTFKVESTGASISTACSVSLIYHYCSRLLHDEYFTSVPHFYYNDDNRGVICRVVLPPSAPCHSIDSAPCPSREDAKRAACLKACIELHKMGALTDYLLPHQLDEVKESSYLQTSGLKNSEDEISRGELHEMLVPAALRTPLVNEHHATFNFYLVQFVPVPEDRDYKTFGLFAPLRLPEEAETMQLDLHLAHGRIVKASLVHSGVVEFHERQIIDARNFQEMYLKILLDRTEFMLDYIPLGKKDEPPLTSSTFYLLLPLEKLLSEDRFTIDWTTIRDCLSSPAFRASRDIIENTQLHVGETLELIDGPINVNYITKSLVFTPRTKLFFFVTEILHGVSATSRMESYKDITYAEYYKGKFGISLQYEQPLLKAKQLFICRNLLHNRLLENSEARGLKEHFVELPPELCSLKIINFSKDIGSSLSLLPSLMHRLEGLLVAVELKEKLSASFSEGSQITAHRVLEAITSEKCMERFSLERLEILGDAYLKYAVSRHLFLSCRGFDEGQLTKKRSSIVNNAHLYNLAIRSNLQAYIRDECFEPSNFLAVGRPCTNICNEDTINHIHFPHGEEVKADVNLIDVKCSKSHHWLHRKTVADVVEAMIGAFLVECGYKGASSFLRWIGIPVDSGFSHVSNASISTKSNAVVPESFDISGIESSLGYRFRHKYLLVQAFVHPSYNKYSGGCYQRLEFLGDAVLDYMITSYLYSAFPDLKPGQLTDLRSMMVNNNSFARIAVHRQFHLYLISDSKSLSEDVKKFATYVKSPATERALSDEPKCPKVLGDLVESCFGAILLDCGFDLAQVWKLMLSFLDPIVSLSSLQLSPIRELQELCQTESFNLSFHSTKENKIYTVEAKVLSSDRCFIGQGVNPSQRIAKRSAAENALLKLKS